MAINLGVLLAEFVSWIHRNFVDRDRMDDDRDSPKSFSPRACTIGAGQCDWLQKEYPGIRHAQT